MKYLDLTFPSPEQNLACDEALLDWRDEQAGDEILRCWEPQENFVVLGYANKSHREVNLDRCREKNIRVLRRCSGGGAVLQGPGCLNYSLVLKIPEIKGSISETNCFVMSRQKEAVHEVLSTHLERETNSKLHWVRPSSSSPEPRLTTHASFSSLRASVEVQGITDLTLGGLKFSGNSQRRKREYLLFHGSFLLNFDLELIEELLPLPSKWPDYRKDRSHTEFLMNLNLPAEPIKEALQKTWKATELCHDWPAKDVEALAAEKYSKEEWNFRF